MDKWQDSLTDFIPVIAFMGVVDMLRPILTPELEKKLGRKLTDWDWQYYLHEYCRKVEEYLQQEVVRQRLQRFFDKKIIHDFVWKGE
jgi:hypothetical protein